MKKSGNKKFYTLKSLAHREICRSEKFTVSFNSQEKKVYTLLCKYYKIVKAFSNIKDNHHNVQRHINLLNLIAEILPELKCLTIGEQYRHKLFFFLFEDLNQLATSSRNNIYKNDELAQIGKFTYYTALLVKKSYLDANNSSSQSLQSKKHTLRKISLIVNFRLYIVNKHSIQSTQGKVEQIFIQQNHLVGSMLEQEFYCFVENYRPSMDLTQVEIDLLQDDTKFNVVNFWKIAQTILTVKYILNKAHPDVKISAIARNCYIRSINAWQEIGKLLNMITQNRGSVSHQLFNDTLNNLKQIAPKVYKKMIQSKIKLITEGGKQERFWSENADALRINLFDLEIKVQSLFDRLKDVKFIHNQNLVNKNNEFSSSENMLNKLEVSLKELNENKLELEKKLKENKEKLKKARKRNKIKERKKKKKNSKLEGDFNKKYKQMLEEVDALKLSKEKANLQESKITIENKKLMDELENAQNELLELEKRLTHLQENICHLNKQFESISTHIELTKKEILKKAKIAEELTQQQNEIIEEIKALQSSQHKLPDTPEVVCLKGQLAEVIQKINALKNPILTKGEISNLTKVKSDKLTCLEKLKLKNDEIKEEVGGLVEVVNARKKEFYLKNPSIIILGEGMKGLNVYETFRKNPMAMFKMLGEYIRTQKLPCLNFVHAIECNLIQFKKCSIREYQIALRYIFHNVANISFLQLFSKMNPKIINGIFPFLAHGTEYNRERVYQKFFYSVELWNRGQIFERKQRMDVTNNAYLSLLLVSIYQGMDYNAHFELFFQVVWKRMVNLFNQNCNHQNQTNTDELQRVYKELIVTSTDILNSLLKNNPIKNPRHNLTFV